MAAFTFPILACFGLFAFAGFGLITDSAAGRGFHSSLRTQCNRPRLGFPATLRTNLHDFHWPASRQRE
jgi:hypothetical protein